MDWGSPSRSSGTVGELGEYWVWRQVVLTKEVLSHKVIWQAPTASEPWVPYLLLVQIHARLLIFSHTSFVIIVYSLHPTANCHYGG